MMTQMILPLADAQATLETVGGKGASLARLAAAGLPVPDGFHVTTTAYRQFVAESNLDAQILMGSTTFLGAVAGLLLGIATHNVPVNLLLGLIVGLGTGASLERQHRCEKVDLEQCLSACTPLLVFIAVALVIWFEIRLW